MLLRRLKLNYFGRFQNKEIELKPGINLIYGENEAGKSTLHTFIKGMFFGIERMRGRGAATKDDIYQKYLPWDYPGAYSGSLELEENGRSYQLSRSFHANDKRFSILDLATGREIKQEGSICDLLPGLTEATYKNTISIEQLKASTDAELAARVQNYMANLSLAKSQEVDVSKAAQLLTEQRKLHDTSKIREEIARVKSLLEENTKNEERLDYLSFQLRELQAKEQQIRERREAICPVDSQEEQRIRQLPAILEKYLSYERISVQLKQLEHQQEILKNKQGEIVLFEAETDEIEKAVKELEQKQRLQVDLEQVKFDLTQMKDRLHKSLRKKQIISFIILVFLILMILIIIPITQAFKLLLIAAVISVGIGIYFIMGRAMEREELKFRQKEDKYHNRSLELEEEINRLLFKYRIKGPEELVEKQKKAMVLHISKEHAQQQMVELEQRLQELEDEKDVLYEAIMKYIQYFLEEDELNRDSIQRLQVEIERRQGESASRTQEKEKELEACRLELERLRWEIASLEDNEEQLLKNMEYYKELEKKEQEESVELDAINLALTTMKELASDIHDSFGQQLNRAVSEIIQEVTNDKYQDLKIDEKLNIKLCWKGTYVALDKLSAGTIDQVYLALRLAMADLLIGRNQVPLILDDSFALYDEARVKAALSSLAKRKQIILFTCHKREEALLQELGLQYHLVDLSK